MESNLLCFCNTSQQHHGTQDLSVSSRLRSTPYWRYRRFGDPAYRYSTGITGYIGGDAFVAINEAHPDYHWTVLIRTEEKAKLVKEKYPRVNVVIGDLDSSDLIKEQASKADIVLRRFRHLVTEGYS